MVVTQSNTKTRKELEAISEKIKGSRLKIQDLVIPIVLSIVLIFVSIFVFIPMIKSAISSMKEYQSIKEKEQKIVELKNSLSRIDSNTMETDLIAVKNVIPKTLKVSSFIYYIDQLAEEKNLSSETISAGDINVSIKEDKNAMGYKGVNGPLAYSGSLENILSFLDSFYSSSPYIVSAENIELRRVDEIWKVNLSLTGYYISDDENIKFDIYRPFKAYTDFSDIIEILREKAKRLSS